MAITLYHVTWCPECRLVHQKLEELGLQYQEVGVPDWRSSRKEVFEVSGQYYVPVLKDGEIVFTETQDILEHLDRQYANQTS